VTLSAGLGQLRRAVIQIPPLKTISKGVPSALWQRWLIFSGPADEPGAAHRWRSARLVQGRYLCRTGCSRIVKTPAVMLHRNAKHVRFFGVATAAVAATGPAPKSSRPARYSRNLLLNALRVASLLHGFAGHDRACIEDQTKTGKGGKDPPIQERPARGTVRGAKLRSWRPPVIKLSVLLLLSDASWGGSFSKAGHIMLCGIHEILIIVGSPWARS